MWREKSFSLIWVHKIPRDNLTSEVTLYERIKELQFSVQVHRPEFPSYFIYCLQNCKAFRLLPIHC